MPRLRIDVYRPLQNASSCARVAVPAPTAAAFGGVAIFGLRESVAELPLPTLRPAPDTIALPATLRLPRPSSRTLFCVSRPVDMSIRPEKNCCVAASAHPPARDPV